MAEIIEIFSLVRRLFAPDSIPVTAMTAPSNLKRLQERYKFAEIAQSETQVPVQQLVVSRGEYLHSNSVYSIQQLTISSSIVQFTIAGDDHIAESFYKDFVALVVELDPSRNAKLQEYTKTFQTVAIARLEVPFDALISERMRKFINEKALPKLKRSDAELELRFSNLSWQASYQSNNSAFMYLPRPLTIEPRIGSKVEDQIYFTVSPTDVATHKELLEDFEKALSGSKQQIQGRPKDVRVEKHRAKA